jgi:hypothetical protein
MLLTSTYTMHFHTHYVQVVHQLAAYTDLQYHPNKSLNRYDEVSLCIMALSTIIPNPAIELGIQSVVLFLVSKCHKSHTLKQAFMYDNSSKRF